MKSLLYIGNKISHHGYSPGVIETLGKQLESVGFKVYYAGTYKNPVMRFAQMVYKTIIKAKSVDFILIDTYSTNAFWYAFTTGMIARALNTKYIPILHGGDLPSRLNKSKWACSRLFNNSYINVAVSGYLNHAFEVQKYSVTLIPNSINIDVYRFKKRTMFNPKILWVRAFNKIYNPNMAVDVLLNLLETFPQAELCMVGPDNDGSMAEFMNYAVARGINKNITITGKLTNLEWTSLSENYDFFINTTNIDNTPVSVIEAMALGLVIVSTNPGGIPYLLKNDIDSKLVNKGDAVAMAAAIKRIIKMPAEGVSITNAARLKAESFSCEKTIKLWISLLS